MKVDIAINPSDARRWLIALKAALETEGHRVRFCVSGAPHRNLALEGVMAMEGILYGHGRGLWRRCALPESAALAQDSGCLIDLSGEFPLDDSAAHENRLTLWSDGRPGIAALSAAVLAGRVPAFELRDREGMIVLHALPAQESAGVLLRAFDEIFARLITIIRAGLTREGAQTALVPHQGVEPRPRARSPLGFFLASLHQKLRTKLRGGDRRSEHWRVGIRKRSATPSIDGDHLIEGVHWLPDDGARYYADPILFEHAHRHFLFVEEFPYATRKGIIAVTELDSEGQALYPPRPIIESRGHLSYPFVFHHAGEIYMMPENAAEHRLPIYRTVDFPNHWVLDRVMMEGLGLHDATLFEAGGRWWLFANSADDGGSSWDCLALWHAPSPFGPWSAHSQNPVLIDARQARPAGPVLRIDGRAIRPVQDCVGGYGRFIRFMDVTALGRGSFTQSERGRLLPPSGSGLYGAHTYCRDSRFEAIDAIGPIHIKA